MAEKEQPQAEPIPAFSLNDPGYSHVDPTLPWLDLFLLESAGVVSGDDASAAVRASIHRSFTGKRV